MSEVLARMKKPQTRGYEELVTEAVALHRELLALSGEPLANHHSALRSNEKLTASAFLREALRIGKTTEEKLDEFKAAIDANPELYLHVRALVGETGRRAAETRVDKGALSYPPATNLVELLPRGAEQVDILHAMVECQQVGATIYMAMALGVLIATRTASKTFGTVDDLDVQRTRAEQLQAKLREVCERIPEVATTRWKWTNESKSLATITYTWQGADTGVAVGPRAGSGMRLVEHVSSHEQA